MNGNHILLTGASGSVGSAVLLHLLFSGYTSHSPPLISTLPGNSSYTHHTFDLTDQSALDALWDTHGPFDGVIHLSAIPSPVGDMRDVHNINVTTNYNVLYTAAQRGVKRIVQASSVNAPRLAFAPEGTQRFEVLPITEDEIHAEYLVRTDPSLRIASLCFHLVVPTITQAAERTEHTILWTYSSHKSCATACLLGLLSEGWEGAEAFNIVAPEIVWVGGISPVILGHEDLQREVGTEQLVPKAWGNRVGRMREGWWDGRLRRGC